MKPAPLLLTSTLALTLLLTGCTAAAESPAETPTPTATQDASPGSSLNPLPLGETITGPGWDVVIEQVVFGAEADAAVAAANELNPAPKAGHHYALVRVSVTRTAVTAAHPFELELALVTGEGVALREVAAEAPERFDSLAEQLPDAVQTGNLVFLVPEGAEAGSLISVVPGDRDERAYVVSAQ